MKKVQQKTKQQIVDYIDSVNVVALQELESLCNEMLVGRATGNEFVALNPTRADKSLGSFKINLSNGVWADFATHDSGGDPVSLYAYLYDLRQYAAARELGQRIGVAA